MQSETRRVMIEGKETTVYAGAFPDLPTVQDAAAAPSPPAGGGEPVAVLREYEAWEADVIMNADWSEETPRLKRAQWDWLVDIQGKRNAALSSPDAAQQRIRELEEALRDVLSANDEFRAQLPDDWDGDPLTDACDRARTALGGGHE